MKLKNVEDVYPLSPLQQGMLFHTLYAPRSGVYFDQFVFTLRGSLALDVFRAAWQRLLDRHTVLRTAFVWQALDEPLQIVRQRAELPWEQHDWRGSPTPKQHVRLEALLRADRQRDFDLSTAPLMRMTVVRLADERYQCILSNHHILFDGWSLPLLLDEMVRIYDALAQNHEIRLKSPRPYRDYIAWLQQQDVAKSEAFWRSSLKGFTAPTRLGVDHLQRRTGQTHADGGHLVSQSLSVAILEPTTAALQSLARRYNLTLNTLLQGAWALLLSCYSGQQDVVFGATVAGRPTDLSGCEMMVGLFINTLPMRVRLPSDAPLLSWLKGIQTQFVELQQYEYSSLVDIQGWSEIPRGLPLFESILVFENYPIDGLTHQRSENIEIEDIRAIEKTNYPLNVFAVIKGPKLSLRIDSDAQRFDATSVERMLEHLRMLLERMVADPNQRIADLSPLTEDEQRRILVEWNATATDTPRDMCIHRLFEAQAARTPDAVALVYDRPPTANRPTSLSPQPSVLSPQHLTYQELNRRANILAHQLRSLGVSPEVRVGVCLERSLEMVIALLGVFKAGGAYVPLDPSYPAERLAFMLEDAQVAVLLTQERLIKNLPSHSASTICLDAGWEPPASRDDDLGGSVVAENLAYVIYTSGSTGTPKGAAIAHASATALIYWAIQVFTPEDLAGVLASTSICFDLSIFELFVPLACGGAIILAEQALQLPFLPARDRVTLINTVPSAIAELLRTKGLTASLRTVNLAGEPLSLDLVQRIYQEETVRQVYNLYGPSEDTTYSTFALLPRESAEPPSIGRPIANTQVYLLDGHLQPVPIGVPGELYLAGAGLARGYLNRPELTAERFVPNPFPTTDRRPPTTDNGADAGGGQWSVVGGRLYRTGDLARYLPDGAIEFLGRIDHQIKLRGFRIELGEVEATLRRHPAVREAVVLAREDVPGEKRLVAYLVPTTDHRPPTTDPNDKVTRRQANKVTAGADGSAFTPSPLHPFTPSSQDLRTFLKHRLPDYMIPAAFVLLDALPLTPNGKLNRQALPAPDSGRRGQRSAMVPPRDPTELQLVRIWEHILYVRPIGVTDNFFDLGGHSLLAVRLMAEIEQQFKRQLPLSALFQGGTIENLAALIHEQAGFLPQSTLVGIQPHGSKPPFFCVHPAGGNVICYTDLARNLGPDYPFYGLQDPGLLGQAPPYTSVVELAAFYIEALRAVWPEGPYLLGGWSFGGVIAFEMAQQLRRQGYEVALLALLDTPTPTPDAPPPDLSATASMVTVLREIGRAAGTKLSIDLQEFERVADDRQLDYISDQFQKVDLGMSPQHIAQIFEYAQRYALVNRRNIEILWRYVPQCYPGRITLFRIAEVEPDILKLNPAYGDPAFGWQAFSEEPIEIHIVPGTHEALVYEPYAPVLAERLRASIDQAALHSPLVPELV